MKLTEQEGLLFYASGGSFRADFSQGCPDPTFCREVEIVDDGEGNRAIQCGNHQALAWKAPHNIYAKRGTLAFFWRSRYPVGPTEFPLFRVGFSDHTSWDATWLRIDYSGSGFDAMITDINLSRARVSWKTEPFPAPDQWIHLAVSWDQDYGVRLYVNGRFAAEEVRPAVYDTGLDQFGPHSRSVSNWRVVNDFNFIRGGDIKELIIYDRMLSEENIARLSNCLCPRAVKKDRSWTPLEAAGKGFRLRHGFETLPPLLESVAGVRKVEIHDAYDLKRWYWKACDGIRETTWPGVHNRSRLKGRNDYFQLPDWDCYNASGKSIVFTAPQEPYNWIEISGSAHGSLEYLEQDKGQDRCEALFYRPSGKERTVHRIGQHFGGKLRFTNDEAEEPIGDFTLLQVGTGEAPEGAPRAEYYPQPLERTLSAREQELTEFIQGRYLPEEQNILLAGTQCRDGSEDTCGQNVGEPFYQVIIPYEADGNLGLDGVELVIPPDSGCAGRSFSVQIKDPLWYYRNLLHITFRVDGRGNCLWMDTRDRLLPENRCLYVTIACDDAGFRQSDLLRWKFSLIYKSRAAVLAEHCADRFTQVRDLYGHLVEEAPNRSVYNMFNRFSRDVEDLMKADPNHIPGQFYMYEKDLLVNGKSTHVAVKTQGEETPRSLEYRPNYHTAAVPEGVPAWAFKQIEFLKHYKYVIHWYIDNRQLENGEFGGGLSDDGDFTSCWVGLILMGCNPEKVLESLERCNDAFYDQGMFTNGLCSIQADELHSAEEGIISLAQCCMADYGNPKFLERAMENARAGFWITGINAAGHRHFKSCYFSGSKMAVEEPWGCQEALSGLALCPSWYVARFNRNPKVMQLLCELADGLNAHYNPEEKIIYSHIRFSDDYATKPYFANRSRGDLFTLYPAYRLTGNARYYEILEEKHKKIDISYVQRMNEYEEESAAHIDKEQVAAEYERRCYAAGIRRYYNTEGSPWIDRVELKYQEIQYDRLAGIGYERRYVVYPRNRVAWRFERENDDERIAILSPVALDHRIKLIICNISRADVQAELLGGEMTAGLWKYELGVDENDDDLAEQVLVSGELQWMRGEPLNLCLPAGKTCVLNMELEEAGEPVETRCDLGISPEDVRRYAHGLNVRVHSLGHTASQAAKIALKDPDGAIVKMADVPPLDAPEDLYPRTWDVIFNVYDIPDLSGYTVELDPYCQLSEITRRNNCVRL